MLKKRDGRLRRVQIPETDILDWFTGAVANWQNVNYLLLPMMKDLPEDASVEYVIHHEPMSRCFSFVIHSKTFSPVPEGAEIPHLESGPHWEYRTVGIGQHQPIYTYTPPSGQDKDEINKKLLAMMQTDITAMGVISMPIQDSKCVCNGGSLACDDPRVNDLAKMMFVDDDPAGVDPDEADAMIKFFKGS